MPRTVRRLSSRTEIEHEQRAVLLPDHVPDARVETVPGVDVVRRAEDGLLSARGPSTLVQLTPSGDSASPLVPVGRNPTVPSDQLPLLP